MTKSALGLHPCYRHRKSQRTPSLHLNDRWRLPPTALLLAIFSAEGETRSLKHLASFGRSPNATAWCPPLSPPRTELHPPRRACHTSSTSVRATGFSRATRRRRLLPPLALAPPTTPTTRRPVPPPPPRSPTRHEKQFTLHARTFHARSSPRLARVRRAPHPRRWLRRRRRRRAARLQRHRRASTAEQHVARISRGGRPPRPPPPPP